MIRWKGKEDQDAGTFQASQTGLGDTDVRGEEEDIRGDFRILIWGELEDNETL